MNNNGARMILQWYIKTVEELEDMVFNDHSLSNVDKTHLNGTIVVLKRKIRKYKKELGRV